MSTVITLPNKKLYGVLLDLSGMFPKGSAEMPIGIHVKNGKFKVVCLQGIVYQATLDLDDEYFDINIDTTILYHDICVMLDKDSSTDISFEPTVVSFTGYDFQADFQLGYSSVEEQHFDDVIYKDITNQSYVEGLKTLNKAGLDKLYKLFEPVIIDNDIALQKYPNTWIQVRAIGLSFEAVLDIEHTKLLTKFKPSAYSDDLAGSILFKNNRAILQLPAKNNNSTGNILDLMKDFDTCVTLDIEKYVERIRAASKITTAPHCKITVFEKGLKTTIRQNNSEVSVSTGNTSGLVKKVCHIPLLVWMTFLKCLDAKIIQVLTGGDNLCLRTQSTIIVTRALP